MKIYQIIWLLAANAASAQTMVPPPPVSGGGSYGAGGGGVSPEEACLLAGGTDCAMADPGVTFPSITGTVGVTTPATLGGAALTLAAPLGAVAIPGGGQLLWIGPGSQLNFDSDNATINTIMCLDNLSCSDSSLHSYGQDATNGWWFVGSGGIDPGGISITESTPTIGTVNLGSYTARSDASTDPLVCAATRVEETPGNVVREACFMPDGSLDVGLATAGTDATLDQTGIDKSSGSTETFALTNSGAGQLSVMLDAAGDATTPVLTFAGDTNTGIYHQAGDVINITTGGIERMTFFSNVAIQITQAMRGGAGTAGAPTFSFTSDSDTGVYNSGTNGVGLAAGGVAAFVGSAAGSIMYDGTGAAEWSCDNTGCGITGGDNIVPTSDDTSNLGSTSLRFKRGLFGAGSSSGTTPAVAVGQDDAGLYYSGGLILGDNSGSVGVIATGAGNDVTLSAEDDIVVNPTDRFNLSAGGNADISGTSGVSVSAADGNLVVTTDAAAIGAGSCTSDALTAGSDNAHGNATGTCNTSQTLIVTFGVDFTNAPICVCSAATTAAEVTACNATTSALTITAGTAAGASVSWNYVCVGI